MVVVASLSGGWGVREGGKSAREGGFRRFLSGRSSGDAATTLKPRTHVRICLGHLPTNFGPDRSRGRGGCISGNCPRAADHPQDDIRS